MPSILQNNDHSIGNKEAPVILLEYGDFECPYCGEAYPIIQAVRKRMNNQLLFVYRHFPLSELHPHAKAAAYASEAAARQGKFWEMHNKLFENQEQLDHKSLIRYAKDLQLNLEQFKKDFESKETIEKVQSDIETGAKQGITGTPTFFINGQKYNGSYNFDELLSTLQEEEQNDEL